MRPEPRKETSKSAVAARAKMMQAANLGWLEGFPVGPKDGGLHWVVVPAEEPAKEITIDGRNLSRATYTLNKLRTELAPALPRLADEPDRWMESIERRLELLKGAVHHGASLPSRAFEALLEPRSRNRAARIADAEPRLQPLLDAVAWTHAGDPARTRTMIDVAAVWADGLGLLAERLGQGPALIVGLRLLQLAAEHGPDLVEPLASFLFDRRVHEVRTGHGTVCDQIQGALSRRPTAELPEELPSGRLGAALVSWCEELAQRNRRTQRLCLRLFALATPLPIVEAWDRWWESTRRLIREARGLAAQVYEKESRKAFRSRVDAHEKAAPPTLQAEGLLERLRSTLESGAPAWTEPLARALALVPDGATAFGLTRLFLYWSTQAAGSMAPLVPAMLAGFEHYLKRRPVADPKALIRPWAAIERGTRNLLVEDEIDAHFDSQPRHRILAVYDHLAAVAEIRGGLGREEAVRVVELFSEAAATGLDRDPGLTAALLDSLVKNDRLDDYFRTDALRLAIRLCRSRPETFAEVLKTLSDAEQPDLSPNQWPESVLEPLCSGELVDVVRESIVTRQLSRLLTCGMKSILLDAAGIRPLPLPVVGEPLAEDPAWMKRFPNGLHPQLRRLAALLEDAEARVGRWLANDLPDTARLEREIAAIQARIDQVEEDRRSALRTRLANLRSRLEQPAAPSAARIERLKTKLDRAWGRTILDRWEQDLDAQLSEALRRLIGLEEIPDWMIAPRNLELVASAAQLAPRHRSLAWRLFRERCGPPPWDLRDAPQNLAFRQRLSHLDWSPWLEGIGTTAVQAGETRLHLRLEDDPLEVFRMGGHFQTCLSPGSFNYFSVFTNAADINKRVIYAHDDDGRFVGRCLLALTAEGRLLMFQAYCHDGSLGFETICSNFVDDLARRMGTERIRDGEVPTLVATDWYDDGALDLGHRFACLEEKSELRLKLATIRPGDLIAELRRSLKPARLNEVTLPLVLDLPELRERPELAVPLLRLVAEHRNLPDETVVGAAYLGMQAGAGDLVRRLLVPRVADHVRRRLTAPWRRDLRAVDVLLQLDPVRLIDTLRRIRARKSARDWSEVTDETLLESAARALAALHRPRQAQAVWQRLATLKGT